MQRPEPTSRHPLIVIFLIVIATSGLSVLLGAPAPGSVEEAVGSDGALAWGLALLLGSVLMLLGLILQPYDRLVAYGVFLELSGVGMLGWAAILYAGAAWQLVGASANFPAALTLGFGVACLWRWGSLIRGIWQERQRQGKGARRGRGN